MIKQIIKPISISEEMLTENISLAMHERETCMATSMATSMATFVTTFFKIYDEPPLKDRTLDWRMIHFEQLAKTGIPLLIYTCDEYFILLAPYLELYPNLRIGKIMDFIKSETWQTVMQIDGLSLPEKRCVTKDTKEYIALMNAKTEFMKYAIDENPWNSTHFAWIDFNIFHIFKSDLDSAYASDILSCMTRRQFQQEYFLVVPGCWDYNWTNEWSISNEVCWRFCGGFFMGTKNAVLDFCTVYDTAFPDFLRKFGVLTWEVNVWSWLELNGRFSPMWYRADHNARILEFTADVCCVGANIQNSVRYPQVDVDRLNIFIPTSTSYLYDSVGKREIVNTRLVNYTILENGCYCIRHDNQHLHTRNIMTLLDSEGMPTEFIEIKVEEGLVNYGGNVYGLEDIRLYRLDGDVEDVIRFVCSNKNYIPNLKTRIMAGIYDVEKGVCRDMRILHPPTDTYCEKNWIPLPFSVGNLGNIYSGNNISDFIFSGHEYFIYSWMPFEIGRLDETNQLRIVLRYVHNTPFWRDVRGSSPLQETDAGYLCVVHFSEEKSPRHYFHLLVLLEKGTYKPLKYSRFFYFHAKSIEFCTGFCKKGDVYCFWISNFDRDPEYLEIACADIDLCYDIAILQK